MTGRPQSTASAQTCANPSTKSLRVGTIEPAVGLDDAAQPGLLDGLLEVVSRRSASADVEVDTSGEFVFEHPGHLDDVEHALALLEPAGKHDPEGEAASRRRRYRREVTSLELAAVLHGDAAVGGRQLANLALALGRERHLGAGDVAP